MKNKHFEWMRAEAKKYAKTWWRNSTVNKDGNALYHCYTEPKTEGWWDDVAFRLGSQVVIVWWVHPRMKYSDTVENMAIEACNHLYPHDDNWFEGGTKIYKKLGKNKKRKRHIMTQMKESSSSMKKWSDALRAKEKEIHSDNEISVRPSISVQQLSWARGVELCMPVEAVDAISVNEMANIAKRLLKGEVTLEQLFPGYTYTKEDWTKEAFNQTKG